MVLLQKSWCIHNSRWSAGTGVLQSSERMIMVYVRLSRFIIPVCLIPFLYNDSISVNIGRVREVCSSLESSPESFPESSPASSPTSTSANLGSILSLFYKRKLIIIMKDCSISPRGRAAFKRVQIGSNLFKSAHSVQISSICSNQLKSTQFSSNSTRHSHRSFDESLL